MIGNCNLGNVRRKLALKVRVGSASLPRSRRLEAIFVA